jgi:hypothetical protein
MFAGSSREKNMMWLGMIGGFGAGFLYTRLIGCKAGG